MSGAISQMGSRPRGTRGLIHDGTFTYDAAGQLVRAESVTRTTVYTYPAGAGPPLRSGTADGVRVALAVDGVETRFVVDRVGLPQVLVESSGTHAITYVCGTARLAQVEDGGVAWFLGDTLGSVRQVVDDDGAVVLAREYSPYGRVTAESGTGRSGYGFTGEQTDATTGLVFLRARWMDPATGRFLSADPWEGSARQPASLHGYLYVVNNPLGYVDPGGHRECPSGTPCFEPGSGPGGSILIPGDRDLTNWLYRELIAAVRTPEVITLRFLALQSQAAFQAMALEGWASLVRDRHRWDFKHKIRVEFDQPKEVIVFHESDGTPFAAEYSVPGNIFYGYVGRSIFPGWLLHLGAGYAEGTDPAHVGDEYWRSVSVCKEDYGFYLNPNWIGTLNDDPEDYQTVELGIQLWRTYRENMSEHQFVRELETHRFHFPLVPPIPYGANVFGWHNPRGGWPYPVGHFDGTEPSWFDRLGLFQN